MKEGKLSLTNQMIMKDTLIKNITELISSIDDGRTEESSYKVILFIANELFKMKQKILDPVSKEPIETYKPVWINLRRMIEELQLAGFEIIDMSGEIYDMGMNVKVVAVKPDDKLERETIIQTIKPAIKLKGRLLQSAEVIVGEPKKN